MYRFEMESEADFDGGICCVARADPMFFIPEERMTCEYVDLNDVEFEYIENEELIGHIIDISADVPKVRVRCSIKNIHLYIFAISINVSPGTPTHFQLSLI